MEGQDVEDFSGQEDERHGTKYPESRSNPATSWTAKKKAEKWDAEIVMKNNKANGFSASEDSTSLR
jgi:hypothetical protein